MLLYGTSSYLLLCTDITLFVFCCCFLLKTCVRTDFVDFREFVVLMTCVQNN